MVSHHTDTRLRLAPQLAREYLVHHGVCPLRFESDGTLVVGVSESGCYDAVADVGIAYEATTRAEPLTDRELEQSIEGLSISAENSLQQHDGPSAVPEDDALDADLRELANQPPVVRYVNTLFRDAVEIGASDIHLEAVRGGGLSIRFRSDGVMTAALPVPPVVPQAVVSRVKLLAELDIAERRLPQDGRIRVRMETRDLDIRVSTVPSLHGESVVMRLLDQGGRPAGLAALGMSERTLELMSKLAQRPHGLVLVTGPTGSGKTTTLHAALQRRDSLREKIITIEDPVEYHLPGITQVPVHQRTGVTFGTILRSVLRQDPDVLMVGELRDSMTAEVAVQAAMTGHLVYASLHTNDAIGTVARLIDLGVPDYLVGATLEAVLAQRLVRRICDGCRIQYEAPSEQVALVCAGPTTSRRLSRGAGCSACLDSGYRGRIGVFELLIVDEALKNAISTGAPRSELARLAAESGMVSIRADGWQKVAAGLTTLEEVIRVSAA